MTKIIMLGCNGRMGQMITDMVKQDDECMIVAGIDIVDNRDNGYPVYTKLADCDVEADAIIDFTSATDFESRMDYAVDKQIPIIECSTGLSEEQMDYLKKASEKVAVLKSANMSLGINLLMKLLKEAAVKLAGDGFDVEIVEKHHNQKLDAPSGTALALAILLMRRWTIVTSIYMTVLRFARSVTRKSLESQLFVVERSLESMR